MTSIGAVSKCNTLSYEAIDDCLELAECSQTSSIPDAGSVIEGSLTHGLSQTQNRKPINHHLRTYII